MGILRVRCLSSHEYFPQEVNYFPQEVNYFPQEVNYFPQEVNYFPQEVTYFPAGSKNYHLVLGSNPA
jgi:hypothetical protein